MSRPPTWFPFDPEVRPFALVSFALFALGYLFSIPWIWFPALLALIVFLGFFRDPSRKIPRQPGAVVSPADGKVIQIHTNENPEAGPVGGPCITIFLSVLDVHVARSPYAGVVTATRLQPGIYHDARDPRAAQENKAHWVFMDCGEYKITVRLIAGWIARQIVCRVYPGSDLKRGERIAMIRFGSRTELYLPPQARLEVEVGQRVKAAQTVVAWLPVNE